jgi:hypothetical protein
MDAYNSPMSLRFLRWLAPLVLGMLLALPCHAQTKRDGGVAPADLRAKEETSSGGGRVPIFEFILVIGGTAMILFILCMPSRKR